MPKLWVQKNVWTKFGLPFKTISVLNTGIVVWDFSHIFALRFLTSLGVQHADMFITWEWIRSSRFFRLCFVCSVSWEKNKNTLCLFSSWITIFHSGWICVYANHAIVVLNLCSNKICLVETFRLGRIFTLNFIPNSIL